jgi:hypothetical protein
LARSRVMAASRGRLPTSVEAALEEIADIEQKISALEQELILEDDDGGKTDEVVEPEPEAPDGPVTDWLPPRFCVPINADVRTFNFKVRLWKRKLTGACMTCHGVVYVLCVCLPGVRCRTLARLNWN